jgi:cobyrinic acid a,c-diamide synthase
VLLVVNCQSIARSAAAIVKGFQLLNPKVRIAAVFANKVGSQGHYRLVKQAVEQECGVPLIGYLEREEQLEIPERHLGLVPSIERGDLQPLFDRLADRFAQTVDLDRLLAVAQAEPLRVEPVLFPAEPAAKRVKIAVAKDAAFHFYYPENLELLEAYGAECLFFSPLAGETVPAGVHGLYLGGGFPEEFAAQLSGNRAVSESVRRAIHRGLPTLAECGGFMYLCEELETTDGQRYPLVGVIPGRITMQRRLAALGYREVTGIRPNFLLGEGESAKGHEFHYSTYAPSGDIPHAYETKGLRGVKREGFARGNLVAGYTHLHFASNPAVVKRWIERCREVAQDG